MYTTVAGMTNLVRVTRRCSRHTCSLRATATLTYDYASRTAVVGALVPEADPGSYDLCEHHAETLSVPLGWEILRLPRHPEATDGHSSDDLFALADAIRAAGMAGDPLDESPTPGRVVEVARKGHLRVIADASE